MLNYSNATSGTYDSVNGTGEFVSAMVTDSGGNILYYGRLKAIKSGTDESGTVDITIPSGLVEGSYTLKVFSEQYNGEYKTDYASVPAGSSLTASGITSTGATLTWTPAQDITAVTGYKLYQNGTELATIAGNVYSYTISGLSSSTSYGFQVQAGNQDGVWTIGGPSGAVTTLKKSNSGSGENSESN